MNNLNKTILLSITCVLAVCLAAGIAMFDTDESKAASTVGNYTDDLGIVYTCYDNGTASLTSGTANTVSGDIVIPSMVTLDDVDYTVTTVGYSAFGSNTRITSVTFPSTVTAIENFVFNGCTALISVDLSATTTLSIGSQSFQNCENLVTFDIGSSKITSFGSSVFQINWGQSYSKISTPIISDGKLYFIPAVEKFTVPEGVTEIITYAAYYNKTLKDITVSSEVSNIGSNAFYNNTALEKVIFEGSGDISIGDYAFSGCTSFTTLDMGQKNISSLGRNVFSNCKLTSAVVSGDTIYVFPLVESYVMPETVTKIADGAAQKNTVLKNVTFSNLVSIGSNAFNGCTSIESLNLPSTLDTIGYSAFSGCTSLTSVEFNDAPISSVGSSVFSGCSKLGEVIYKETLYFIPMVESYTVPSNVTAIAQYAASNNSALRSVVIPDNVVTYGNYIFYFCTNLESVTLPDNITILTDSMFQRCTNLSKINADDDSDVNIPESVTTIGKNALNYCGIKTLVIPEKVNTIGNSAFTGCSALTTVVFKGTPSSIGTGLFSSCGNLVNVTLPEGMKTIPGSMFNSCNSLVTIDIPSTVTEIGSQAFSYSGIEGKLVLPEGLVTIGESAFNGVFLSEIVLPSTCESIGNYGIVLDRSSEGKLTIVVNGPTNFGRYYFSGVNDLTFIINAAASFNNTFSWFDEDATLSFIIADGIGFYVDGTPLEVDGEGYVTVNLGDAEHTGKMLAALDGTVLNISKDCIAIDPALLTSEITSVVVDPENPHFKYVDGALTYDDSTLVFCLSSGSRVAVPEGVKTIGTHAFAGAPEAKVIVMPASVIRIMTDAVTCEAEMILLGSTPAILADAFSGNDDVTLFFALGAYSGEDLSGYQFGGYYVSTATGTLLVTLNDYAVPFALSEKDGAVTVTVELSRTYSDSVLSAKLDGKDVEIKNGVCVISSVSGEQYLNITGIEFNTYSVKVSVEGADVAIMPGKEDVRMDSVMTFSVIPKSGYSFGADFSVTIDGKVATPVSKDGRRAVYSFVLEKDTEVVISGLVLDKIYDVTFNTNGGSSVESQKVVLGDMVAVPETPVLEGKVLAGWYADATLTKIFDFSTPVSSNVALYAKWIDAVKEVTVTFEADNGTLVVTAGNGESIISGKTVTAGTVVKFEFKANLQYEIMGWIINGESYGVKDPVYFLEVTEDTTVTVVTIYNLSTGYTYITETATPYGDDGVLLWELKSPYGNYASTAIVFGDYLYMKSGSKMCKVSLADGKLVASVETSIPVSFYAYPIAGNGYIVDGASGMVFDTDLNSVFKLDRTDLKVFYNNGYFYLSDSAHIYCYEAKDMVSSDSANIQTPVWTVDCNRYIAAYQGQSHMVFTDKYLLCVELGKNDSNEIWLSTFSLKDGSKIDSVQMKEQYGDYLNAAYLSYYGGYAYLSVYASGLFDSSDKEIKNLGRVALDANGFFNDVDMQYVEFPNNDHSSSAIVVGDYIYIQSGDKLYALNASNLTIVAKTDAVNCHGNISVSLAYDGKVLIYILPYNNSDDVRIWMHDVAKPTVLTDVSLMDVITHAQYCSQQARFGPNGELIYYNDSGYTFCIGRLATVSPSFNGVGKIVITDKDGNVVEAESVKILQGATITIDGNKVIIGDYTFTASTTSETGKIVWKISEGILRGDLTVAATLAFKVTFTNGEETLQETYVELGEKPVYTGETPVKDATVQYTYTFKGWNTELVAVTGEATYSAEFDSTVNKYTVVFKNGDTVLQSTEVEYGTVPTYTGETPVKDATVQYTYTFKGWNTELVAVTGEATYSAEFDSTVNKYTVKFVSEGAIVSETEYDYGTKTSDIAVPTVTREGYAFVSWNSAVSDVLGDATYSAVWAIDIVVPAESESVEVDLSKGESSFVITTSTDKPVDVKLPENAVVVVSDSSSLVGKIVTADMEKVENKTSAKGTAYEFTFEVDGTGYNGKIQVTLPYTKVSGEEPIIYFVNGSQLEKMNVVSYTDTTVTFETTHNSTYVVSSESVSADDNTLMVVGGILVVVIIFIIGMMFVIRRIKKTQ